MTYSFPRDTQIVKQLFERYFHINPNGYIDNTLTMISRKFVIDIMKFDDFLHGKFGMYDDGDNPLSMKDLITEKYGEEAAVFVESLLL